MPSVFCVVAVPEVGVSTPQAFRDWDGLVAGTSGAKAPFSGDPSGTAEAVPLTRQEEPVSLTQGSKPDRLSELSLAYASLYAEPGTSGIIRGSNPGNEQGGPDKHQGGQVDDLAENTLLSLVRTGVENDFEQVVFPAYPSLREIKRLLMGTGSGSALYAALSGSGSALFGLYRSEADAEAAQQRVHDAGTKALITKTLPRSLYWTRMFAG
jgi:4-diphosphocytidyl-2-C-methyl-D-erythritol kinase